MLRKNGYLVLDDEKEIKKNQDDFAKVHWFFVDGQELMFKSGVSEYVCFAELFGEQVALSLKIPTVSYDLAMYRGVRGVLSPNYNPLHVKEIPLEVILQKYYDEVICENFEQFPNEMFLQNVHNLEDIWWALEYSYKEHANKTKIVEHLMHQIVESYILQKTILP